MSAVARVMKRTACRTREYKKALAQLAQDMGYSPVARVPQHMRVALRSHAEHLAKVRCNIQKTGQPYPRRQKGR